MGMKESESAILLEDTFIYYNSQIACSGGHDGGMPVYYVAIVLLPLSDGKL